MRAMNSLEAKVVILGAQGAGKTSLVVRFVENNFHRNLRVPLERVFWSRNVLFPPFLVLGLTGCRRVDECCTVTGSLLSEWWVTVDMGYRGTRTVSIDGILALLKKGEES